MTFCHGNDGEAQFSDCGNDRVRSDREDELRVYVDRESFADSYSAVLGKIVPVADRVDAGVVVRGDGVQGVALLNPMDDTDGLRIRGCGAS